MPDKLLGLQEDAIIHHYDETVCQGVYVVVVADGYANPVRFISGSKFPATPSRCYLILKSNRD